MYFKNISKEYQTKRIVRSIPSFLITLSFTRDGQVSFNKLRRHSYKKEINI